MGKRARLWARRMMTFALALVMAAGGITVQTADESVATVTIGTTGQSRRAEAA